MRVAAIIAILLYLAPAAALRLTQCPHRERPACYDYFNPRRTKAR